MDELKKQQSPEIESCLKQIIDKSELFTARWKVE